MSELLPDVYVTIPRNRTAPEYLRTAAEVTRWTVAAGLDGILFFAGSGAYLDPWVAAVSLVATTERITPMVAVNPAYAHPLTVAGFVNTIGSLHERRVALNFIAGTSLSELASIGDQLDHGARYRRLEEYATIVTGLLASSRPMDFDGEYYQLSRAQLLPRLAEELRPELFLAGQSESAQRVSKAIHATTIGMLAPDETHVTGNRALHFGICTRPDAEQAWQAAQQSFPEDPIGAAVQQLSVANTDAVWKSKLVGETDPGDRRYWTGPFKNGHADCPYVVTDYAGLAGLLLGLRASGVITVIVDLPAEEQEFVHLAAALELASRKEQTA